MKLLSGSILLMAVALTAQGAAKAPSVVGTWILEKSNNPMPDGTVVSYCTGVHGMITYTADGYVAVALNCGPKPEGKTEPADVSDRKFLYAGTYTYENGKVTHKLLNASQPNLVGTSFTRDVKIEGNKLVLSGENQGQQFSAHWIKSTPKNTTR